jgi:hypothetical protein
MEEVEGLSFCAASSVATVANQEAHGNDRGDKRASPLFTHPSIHEIGRTAA